MANNENGCYYCTGLHYGGTRGASLRSEHGSYTNIQWHEGPTVLNFPTGAIEINYCPLCGRKLVGIKANYEPDRGGTLHLTTSNNGTHI